MDKRLVSLTLYLKEYSTLTAEKLAGHLQVSPRTVRNLIRNWNDYFKELAAAAGKNGVIPSTSSERVDYLLNDLLNRRDFITIDALSDILHISRKTISSDLKEVEQ